MATLTELINVRRSLRARFAWVIGASGLLFALVAAVAVDGYQRAELKGTLGQAMRREALLLSRSLNLAVRERLQGLMHTVSDPLLSTGLMEPGELRLTIEALRLRRPELAWLAFTDESGLVGVATNTLLEGENLSGEPVFQGGMRGPWVGSRHDAGPLTRHLGLDVRGKATELIDMGAPLIDYEGRRRGVLIARLRWDWLAEQHQDLMAPQRRLPGSQSIVLDGAGRVLLGPPEMLDQVIELPGLTALRAGAAPLVLDWPDGGRYLTALGLDLVGQADGPGAALTVLMRQPEALAFQAADVLRQRLVVAGVVGSCAFVLLSLWLGTRVARPIKALSVAAEGVGRGEAPAFGSITPRRQDEVAQLARSLQSLHLELARRMEEQRAATARYELLFRNAPVAIYVVWDRRVQMVNQACVALFRASAPEDLHGKTTHQLFHPDDHPTLDARYRLLGTSERPHGALPMATMRIVRLDGSVAEVESTAMPLQHELAKGGLVVLRDVSEERRAHRLLRQREAQLAQTSEMARVGGWTLDLATNRATWTDEMARIFEVPVEAVPDRAGALTFFDAEHRARLQAAFLLAVREGVPYDLELSLHTPSGAHKWVRAQGRPVRDGERIVAMEGYTQDITERRAAQEALHEANAQLERRVAERTAQLQAANAELDSFAYAVSHDLRAPLRAMSGFSQALLEDYGGSLDDQARMYLDQITLASHRMGDLIEGLLALSRSTRGALRLDRVDLSQIAARVVTELRRGDPAREVSVEIEPGMSARGDARMLDVVLRNLVGNAWKYTGRRDQPRIVIGTRQIDGQTWFQVEDNGAGFDMAHAGRLFQAFARLHRQDEFPGIGIGLATVQRIVLRHGGRIEAQAQPGRGACFRFMLPERAQPAQEDM